MSKTFLEISNTLRKQVRSKRIARDWSHQDLADKIDEFINYNGNGKNKYDRSRLSRFETTVENDEDVYLDSELTYYITSILGISLDDLIYSDKNFINTLMKDATIEDIRQIKKIFIMNYKLINEKLSNNKPNFTKEWLNTLYNTLLYSGLKSFIPPLFTIISQYAAGSTSLLNYILENKEVSNIQGYDILYIHSDYKPAFLPKDIYLMYYDKESFTYEKLFTKEYNTKPNQNKKQIAVVFLKSEILKQITILETKYSDNSLNFNFIKDSQNIFLLSDCSNYFSVLPQMVREIFNNFEDKIIRNKDFLTILLSKTDIMMKKELEEIKTQIKESLLKEQKQLLKNNIDIIGYDIAKDESMLQLIEKLKTNIQKAALIDNNEILILINDESIPLYKEKLLAPIGLDVLYEKHQKYLKREITSEDLYNFWNGYAAFVNDLKKYIYDTGDNSFSKITRDKIKSFISNTFNESYLRSKEYITFKDNTNSINVNKQILEDFITDLNKTLIDFVVTKILYHDSSILYTQFIDTSIKTDTNNYNTKLLKDISQKIHKTPIDINSFFIDIQPSNRPTIKFFIKRFVDYKNDEGLILEDVVFNYVFTVLQQVLDKYQQRIDIIINLFNDRCSESELNEYINLYKLFRETHETIKFEINELVYPDKIWP